jgi:hypothetical protein
MHRREDRERYTPEPVAAAQDRSGLVDAENANLHQNAVRHQNHTHREKERETHL